MASFVRFFAAFTVKSRCGCFFSIFWDAKYLGSKSFQESAKLGFVGSVRPTKKKETVAVAMPFSIDFGCVRLVERLRRWSVLFGNAPRRTETVGFFFFLFDHGFLFK